MTVPKLAVVGDSTDTRQKLLDVAMSLIAQHGCASTSLQMIADELGITKAAIYYYFRTRDDLLEALMEPILQQNRQAVENAEVQRTPRAQMEAMVQGYAEVVARHRSLAAVLVFDVSVRHILQRQPAWVDLIGRQLALLMQLEPDEAGFLKATSFFSGLAGAATGVPPGMDEDLLVEHLTTIGRRIMGLRQPRRQGEVQGKGEGNDPRPPELPPGRWKDILAQT